jgi:hypothetical protein
MIQVIPIDQPSVSPFSMSDRFRKEIVYFMTPAEGPEAPSLAKDEYWIRGDDAQRWLDEGGFTLVSPLDAQSVAEIELTEEQESWLEWMVAHQITQVRLAGSV